MPADTNTNITEFDFLEEDPSHLLGGLRFAVMAITRPMNDPSDEHKTLVAVKLKGGFATQAEADDHARSLSKTDPRYDVFVAPFGKWLMMPPDVSQIGDQKTHDQMLTNILQQHNDKDELERVQFEQRKSDMMNVKNDAAAPQADDEASPSTAMDAMAAAENVPTSSSSMKVE